MIRRAQQGFTLVEMLVALTIFALLAAAGVGLLRGSVDTHAAVNRALADLSASERLRLLLASDLAHALNRPSRDSGGAERPAFIGDASGLRLVRPVGGVADGEGRLQAIGWRLAGADLSRSASDTVDGSDAAAAPAVLARNVERASFRYRSARGEWRDSWAPPGTAPPLPAAVELLLRRRGEADLRIVLAVTPGLEPQPVTPPPLPGAGA